MKLLEGKYNCFSFMQFENEIYEMQLMKKKELCYYFDFDNFHNKNMELLHVYLSFFISRTNTTTTIAAAFLYATRGITEQSSKTSTRT